MLDQPVAFDPGAPDLLAVIASENVQGRDNRTYSNGQHGGMAVSLGKRGALATATNGPKQARVGLEAGRRHRNVHLHLNTSWLGVEQTLSNGGRERGR